MADLIWVPEGYEIDKNLDKVRVPHQRIEDKIIEEELKLFAENRVIQGLRFESGMGLHTLRMNLGILTGTFEHDLIVHMAKESLKAFQLTPGRGNEEGLLVRFRTINDLERYEHINKTKYADFELTLNALEAGFSGNTAEPMGKLGIQLRNLRIINMYPSRYYEDRVQIHFENRTLLLRIDPTCLYGVGIGEASTSTSFSSKNDTIFHWGKWIDSVVGRYYGGNFGGSSYAHFQKRRVEVKTESDSE